MVVEVAGAVVVVVAGAAAIANVTVAVAEPAVAPVAVIVTDAVDAADGVPPITPVDDEMTRPAGNEPDVTAYETAPVMFVGVKAVVAAIAVPAVPETV
jgi:hypothetical protein